MALKATIFKADLQIADLDRNHFKDYSLTLARHPSETDERMMVRLLAFALHADELRRAADIAAETVDLSQKIFALKQLARLAQRQARDLRPQRRGGSGP